MKIFRLSIFLLFTFFSFSLSAQDPELTQTFANPMYANPAFAGFQENFRAGIQYRDQWSAFQTSVFSADMGIPRINSGVGIMLMNDVEGNGNLITNSFYATYAHEFKIRTSSYIRVGLTGGFFQRTINWGSLRLGDQIDAQNGFIYAPTHITGVETIPLTPNFSLGGLFYNKYLYTGLAILNIFEPGQSFFSNPESVLPTRFSFQAGGFINCGSLIINPNIIAQKQATFSQALPGVNVTWEYFTLGTSVRLTKPNTDAVNFLFGIAKGKFKFCYSHDFTISKVSAEATGSNEFSLVFQLSRRHDTSEKPMVGFLRNAF